jgi:hypothetical protein
VSLQVMSPFYLLPPLFCLCTLMFRRIPAHQYFHQIYPKVFSSDAESRCMDHEINPPADSNDPTFLRARALSLSVGAIRKAQGKKCPGDFPVGTIEWHAVVEEFADDVLKAMLSEPDLPILELKRDNARK